MNSHSYLFRRLLRHQVLFLLLFLGFVFWQCANPIAPTGGPRDEQPPQIDSARSTPNLQTNFRPERITLTFDEWVKLEKANQQVVISPPVQDYEVFLKGKSVIVDFGENDTLRNNVTYVVQFGEAVKDLTESNPAEDLRFVFSTGPYIDSIEIQGQVLDAYTAEPIDDALVMLYDNLADSVFRTEKPFYFGRTNEQGLFLISNLRAGTYKLTALQDADANYRYNQASESIAFFSEPVNLTADSVPPISMRMFQETLPLQIAEADSSDWGRLKLVFNRLPQQDLELITTTSFIRTQERDSLLLWHQTDAPWELIVRSDTLLSDTLVVPAAPVSSAARRLPLLALKPLPNAPKQLPPGKAVPLSFNRPVRTLDTTFVHLQQDTLLEKLAFSWQLDSTENRQFLLRSKWQTGANYELTLYPGAVTDYWGQTNADTLRKQWTGGDPKKLGNLLLTFTTDVVAQNYYVKVRLPEKPPVAVFSLQGNISYTRTINALPPGEYQLEIIADDNQNQQWDTGNYSDLRQPEKVAIRKLETLRANWDLEAEINLTELFRN